MGVTKQIPREDWKSYFDEVEKRHIRNGTASATIDLISPELGDQAEEVKVLLEGLDYDPKSEALEVQLKDLDRLVFQPVDIWVIEEDDGFVSALEVVHADGVREIMRIERIAEPEPVYPAS
jgi:hypothetical protein